MANPYFVYTNTFSKTGAIAQSGTFVVSFANTAGFEAWIPIQINSPNTANLSAGAQVSVQRSTDGGATYETWADAPIGAAFSLPGANAAQTKDLLIRDPGLFIITIMPGGGSASTWSFAYGQTCAIISAYA